jgi:predicted nucleic acid-binding protein
LELRENVTAYDAAYVALAEILGVQLLTADARLSRAAGVRCDVELLG